MKRACLAVIALLAGVSRLSAADSADILLVAADDASLRPALAKVTDSQSTSRAAWTFWTGRIGGKRVVLTRAEGDPLNAVAATTLGIRLYAPHLIIVFGSGRAHDPALHAGDIVVSEKFAAFDGMVSPITQLDKGIHPLEWQPLPHLLMTAGEKETPSMTFPADTAVMQSALKLSPAHGHVVAGILGSANQVNREADRIAWLRATWHTSTEDGVSAHVAGCAALFGVPVIGVCIVDGDAADAADFALRLAEALR